MHYRGNKRKNKGNKTVPTYSKLKLEDLGKLFSREVGLGADALREAGGAAALRAPGLGWLSVPPLGQRREVGAAVTWYVGHWPVVSGERTGMSPHF